MAWTTDATIMGRKTRTRRNWALIHAKRFHKDQIVDFYNRNPRNGGTVMGSLLLTAGPVRQLTKRMTMKEDFEAEGFAYMTERGLLVNGLEPLIFFHRWREQALRLWVINFVLHDLTVAGMGRKLEL